MNKSKKGSIGIVIFCIFAFAATVASFLFFGIYSVTTVFQSDSFRQIIKYSHEMNRKNFEELKLLGTWEGTDGSYKVAFEQNQTLQYYDGFAWFTGTYELDLKNSSLSMSCGYNDKIYYSYNGTYEIKNDELSWGKNKLVKNHSVKKSDSLPDYRVIGKWVQETEEDKKDSAMEITFNKNGTFLFNDKVNGVLSDVYQSYSSENKLGCSDPVSGYGMHITYSLQEEKLIIEIEDLYENTERVVLIKQ